MLHIRRASASDIPALSQLIAAYWAFEGMSAFDAQAVGSAMQRLLGSPSLGAGWIAVDDERPAGYLLAVYLFSLEHLGLTAEIDELYVDPAARGGGIGARLLATAESEFARLGCTNVSLQLARDNDVARRFYRRAGHAERDRYELLDKPLSL